MVLNMCRNVTDLIFTYSGGHVADVQSVNKLVRISEIQLCSSKANLFESIFES